MTIKDAKGSVVRVISSEKDPTYKPHNGGGAPPKPLLSKNTGLNRFVWDMGYPIMPGIPDVYIEANFRGHRAAPGMYTMELKVGESMVSTMAEIKEMPDYETKPGQYEEYNSFMISMESSLTEMHNLINSLYQVQGQVKDIVKKLEEGPLKSQGESLLKGLKNWDEQMVQRKSKAYDDVENFPNKFTAEYLFLINQTNSPIPRVNKSSRERKTELDNQWNGLKSTATSIIDKELPAFNKALWDAGIGAIKMPE